MCAYSYFVCSIDADEQEVNFDSHLVSTSSKDLKESKDLTHILRLNEQPSSATNSFDTNKSVSCNLHN